MAQEKINIQQDNQQIIIKASQTSSTLSGQYQAFFTNIQNSHDLRQQLLSKLMNNGDVNVMGQHQDYMEIQIVRHTSNFEALLFQVKICQLCVEVNILNSNKESPTHHLSNISNSHWSSIFLNNQVLPGTAIKCFCIEEDNFQYQFVRILRQFCIFKIASILKVGPQMRKTFGFDIVLFKQCAEFCMERCTPIKVMNDEAINQMKSKLRKLHSLRIVHLDIKPDNIASSPSLDEPVFLDFGFSDVLDQPVGMKTNTAFVGTISYCSPQMIDCYNKQCISLVDTYYNDIFALEKSIKQLIIRLKPKSHIYEHEDDEELLCELQNDYKEIQKFKQLALIKYQVFINNTELLKDESYRRWLNKFQEDIVSFCLMLPYSQFLQKVFQYYELNYYQSSLQKDYGSRSILYRYNINGFSISESQSSDSKLHAFITGIIFNRRYLTDLQIKQIGLSSLRDIALNQQMILGLKKEIYFEKFVSFIDFYANHSKFNQRVAAARLMKSIQKLPESQQKKNSSFQDIQICLKHLLGYFISLEKQICVNIIPKIWRNLITIGLLNYDKAVDFFKRIIAIKLSNIKQQALLIMRCLNSVFQSEFKKQDYSQYYKTASHILLMAATQLAQLCLNKGDMYHKFVLHISNLIKLSITFQLPKYQFSLVQEFLKSNLIQIDPMIDRELKIYYYSSAIKHYIQFGQQEMVIKYISALCQLEGKRRQTSIKFQYYHFILVRAMQALGNFSFVKKIYKRLQSCLDNSELFNKFVYYDEDALFLLRRDYYYAIKTYKQFLTFIWQKDLQLMNQRLTCIQFIYSANQFSDKSMIIQNILQQIYSILKIKIPLESIQQIKLEIQNNHAQNIYIQFLMLIVSMTYIHQSNPQIYQTIDFLVLEFKQNWNKIDCKICKQLSLPILIIIQAFLLKKKENYIQAAEVYKTYIQSDSQYFKDLKLSFVIQMVSNAIKSNFNKQKLVQYSLFAYQWSKRNNVWGHFLTLQKKQIFQVINRYLFTQKMYDEFLQVQLKFLQIIKMYPVDGFIKIYIHQLVDFFFAFLSTKKELWKNLSENILSKFNKNDYGILFYAVFLIQLPYFRDIKFKRIVRQICDKVNYLSFAAKSITLGLLYYNLIRIYVKDKTETPKDRFKRFVFKKFMKKSLSNIDFSLFKKKIWNFKHSKMAISTELKIFKLTISHLKQYYNRLTILCQCFRDFNNYFPSPFDVDPFYVDQTIIKVMFRKHF